MNTTIKEKNYNDFLNIYSDLGIDINELNCVMLQLQDIEAKKLAIIKANFPNDIAYYSTEKKYAQGFVLGGEPHVTLLYGLLANTTKEQAKMVIEDLIKTPIKIEIKSIGYFEFADHYCIIMPVEKTQELLNYHQRLSLLPHINTFMGYNPHISIGYIKKDKERLYDYLSNSQIDLDIFKPKQITFNKEIIAKYE